MSGASGPETPDPTAETLASVATATPASPATAPTAATPATPATAASGPASSADALTQSEWARRLVALASVIVVGVSILAIVGVMCYRVVLDGNAPLTNDITTKMMWVAIASILSMVAALFGSNSLVSKAIDKIIP